MGLKKTKLNDLLLEDYQVVNVLPYVSSHCMTEFLVRIAKSDMVILLPKVMHKFMTTDANLMTPQMWYRHPCHADYILLCLVSWHTINMTYVLLKRKEVNHE